MVLRSEGGKCHLNVCIIEMLIDSWNSQASHKLSNVIVAIRISLPFDKKLN